MESSATGLHLLWGRFSRVELKTFEQVDSARHVVGGERGLLLLGTANGGQQSEGFPAAGIRLCHDARLRFLIRQLPTR